MITINLKDGDQDPVEAIKECITTEQVGNVITEIGNCALLPASIWRYFVNVYDVLMGRIPA